jgi:hypothetical protein
MNLEALAVAGLAMHLSRLLGTHMHMQYTHMHNACNTHLVVDKFNTYLNDYCLLIWECARSFKSWGCQYFTIFLSGYNHGPDF